MKSAAIVVCFNPGPAAIENLRAISRQVDYLCVVDNTVTNMTTSLGDFVAETHRATLLQNGNRGGIAGALNLGCDFSTKKGDVDYIFLFDQDSTIPDNFVKEQLTFIEKEKPDVVVPLYYDVNSKSYGNYVLLDRFVFRTIRGAEAKSHFLTTFAITSGTLLRTGVYSSVGRFNEKYFIDHVDTEYCLRIKASGMVVMVNPGVCFRHAIGNRTKHKFLGVTFKPNFHLPFRRYYTARNAVLLIREWGLVFPSLIVLLLLMNLYQIFGVILYENQKAKKIAAFVWGFVDGVMGRNGVVERRL